MELQRKSPETVKACVSAVAHLARHYDRSPMEISLEEVRDYFHWLIVERKHLGTINRPPDLLRMPRADELE